MASTDLVYRFLGIDAGAGAQFDRMGAKTAALGRTSGLATRALKGLAIGAGAAAVAIGVESVKAAANFQTSLARIHTQADASNAAVGRWHKGILAMTDAVATAPNLLAQAAFHIASVGQKSLTSAQQLNILKIAAEGAKIGGANLVDVTNALDAAVVSGIRGVSNYSQAMGVLNATVGAGDMQMQDLADAFGPLGAVMKGYNVSIQQVGAALATFGDNNLRGAEAGTALRMAVQSLAVPVKNGQALLKSWGDKAGNLATQLSHGGLTSALDTLYGLMRKNGVSSREVGDVLTQAFGKRAGIGLAMLIGELDRFHNKLGIVSRTGHNFASSWAGYTRTFGFAWDQMRAAVQRVLIQIGDKLLPTATRFVRWVTNRMIPAVEDAAHKINGPLSSAIHSLSRTVDDNAKSFSDFSKTVGPALTVVADSFKASMFVVDASLKATRVLIGGMVLAAISGLKMMADAALSFMGAFVHAASAAFGWLPFGIGSSLNSAAAKFDAFHSDVDAKLSSLAADVQSLGWAAGHGWAAGFSSGFGTISVQRQGNTFKSIVTGGENTPIVKPVYTVPGTGGYSGGHHSSGGRSGGASAGSGVSYTLPGGSGVAIGGPGGLGGSIGGGSAGGGGGGKHSAAAAAANSLHITAQHLVKALAKGLLDGWSGFSLTVEQSLSTGTQHLLNALSKQFQAVTAKMKKLVADARTTLKNALSNQRQFVQQMMSDASLTNVPTTDSGYLANGGQKLTSIGGFLGGQARSYAAFAKALRQLAHRGLSKALINQIAAMGPTQGLQFAQQILSGGAGSIAGLNASERQIQRSARAMGEDRYGAEIRADRRHLEHMVREQRKTNHHLEHLAYRIGHEVRQQLGPVLAKGLHGQAGLSPHEAQKLERDLRRLNRRLGK